MALLHLRRVSQHVWNVLAADRDEIHAATKHGAEKPGALFDVGAECNDLGTGRAIARNGEILLHEIARTLARDADFIQRLGGGMIRAGLVAGEFGIGEDVFEEVAELMGHAAGERAESFEFVPFDEFAFQRHALFFGAMARGHILHHRHKSAGFATGLHDRRRGGRRNARAESPGARPTARACRGGF